MSKACDHDHRVLYGLATAVVLAILVSGNTVVAEQAKVDEIDFFEEESKAEDGRVKRSMYIPDSFKKSTQLCYEWAPQPGFLHDGNQCAQNQRGLPRKLCAEIGQFTREYLDETDWRPGGCFMSWKIESDYRASWFNDMKICHKWHAQGDAHQCNGNRRDGRNCARVGQEMAHYLDDTDWRGGGCEMSWMLSLPGNAPMWAKNLQVCFKWRATGDRGQCGSGGLPSPVCAKANQWTTPYKDDSDKRHGGCMMSWGIKEH